MTIAARSAGRSPDRTPPYRPTGVRTPLKMTARLIRLRLADELELNGRRKRAELLAPAQQFRDRLAAFVAVVAGQLVHVHADEAVGECGVEAASESERVLHRLGAILEPGLDRLAQHLRELSEQIVPEVPTG